MAYLSLWNIGPKYGLGKPTVNEQPWWVGGELFVTFCYNPKSLKLTQPEQNEPGTVQKSHQRRRTAHKAERGGGRPFW